jgi:hypothetical protein
MRYVIAARKIEVTRSSFSAFGSIVAGSGVWFVKRMPVS